MNSGTQTKRCWTRSSGLHSIPSPLHETPVLLAEITTFPVQMAASDIAKQHLHRGLQIILSIANYIISSGMAVVSVSVHQSNLEISSHLTSNTPSRITTNIDCSVMQIPIQTMPHSPHARFTTDCTWFDVFPELKAILEMTTSSTQCRSACLNTTRNGFSPSWRSIKGSISTMQSRDLCLLATTVHPKIGHLKTIQNGMGRRWKKWAEIYLELYPRLYAMPLVLQVYFWNYIGSLDNPIMDTRSRFTNYHSDFRIGCTFHISSPISQISITRPSHQLINDSDEAKRKWDVYHL